MSPTISDFDANLGRLEDDAVRQIAQSDPVPNLTERWGEAVVQARRQLEALTVTLRELDTRAEHFKQRGLTVAVDLGPIGNAAAAARRDLERERPGPTFSLPKAG